METKALEIFIDVVRMESFAAVARKHDMDPSSVSRIVASLEQEIDVRLFQRTTRKLSLTEAGERYLLRVEPLVEELERARDEANTISSTPSGSLRMTTSVAFGQVCIVPLLEAFHTEYPELALELLMTDDNVDLVRQRVDLAIRLGPSRDKDLIGTRLMDVCYRVVASPEYLSRRPKPEYPEELSGHSCVLLALPEYRTRWLFRDASQRVQEVLVQGKLVISPALAVREAARQSHGPALLPNWMIDTDIETGRLVDLFPAYEVAATSFDTGAWLLYPSRSYLPRKVRIMIDFLKAKLAR